MKKIIYLLAVLAGVLALASCSSRYEIPELTKDVEVKLSVWNRKGLKISYKPGILNDKLVIKQGLLPDIYRFPACHSYVVYKDSIVITSVNRYKLTIVLTEK